MKRFLLPLFTLIFLGAITPSKAQTQDFCGTEMSEKQKNWLIDYAKNGRDFAQKKAAQYYVPLYIHFVGTDEGTGFYGSDLMMKDICELNQQFAPAGFYFYLAGFDYIANTSWYDHANYGPGSTMMRLNNVDDVTNIYIVVNPAGNCGYFSPSRDGVAITKNCMGKGRTTFAHELGHFFSLPHPFRNVLGVKEFVNGSNCKTGGDLFCDTRADYLGTRWQCPYNGTEKDPLGESYDPDGTLYMSYSNDACANRFSLEQIDAMNFNISGVRSNLQGPKQDTMPTMQKVERLFPLEGMPQKPTNAEFRWKKVPNAVGYILQASQISVFPGNLPLDVMTEDTFFVATNLSDSRTYNWRVRPVYAARTCGEGSFSDTGRFFTSKTAGVTSFSNANEVKIYPNPTGYSQQVFIAFENDEKAIIDASIYTIDGKNISTLNLIKHSNQQYAMNISALSTGIYIVNIRTESGVYRQKLMVE